MNADRTPYTLTATPEEIEDADALLRDLEEIIFETFPPGLQRALETGKLDEINKVLAKMSVEEAEEVVEKLGEGGMLSVEQGVIDATTEEGQRTFEEIERSRRMPGDRVTQGADAGVDPETGDPA